MSMRDDKRNAFLAAQGIDPTTSFKIAGDASFRSYYRCLDGEGASLVVMDAPPEDGEDCRPFVAIGRWLKEQDFSAPAIVAEDVSQGFLLLEDLGDALFKPLLEEGTPFESLYGPAVDLLAQLAQIPAPAGFDNGYKLPPYDEAALETEVLLLTDWYYPLAAGRDLSHEAREEYLACWRALWPHVAQPENPVLVLRDYHAENLLWLPDRDGTAKVGLLDFQDGLAGHAAYDLISLADDARRDVNRAERDFMFKRYCAARQAIDAGFDQAAFETQAEILAAQRNAKIVGIFCRLAKRDGKPQYLGLLPRVWGYLLANVQHPAMTDLAAWFETHCPPALRDAPVTLEGGA